MADNTTIGTGVSPGTTTIASDEIGGVQYQRVKVVHGADGSATDASSAAPLPTTDAGVATAVAAVKTAVETLDLQMGAAPAQTGDVQAVRDRLPAALVGGGLPVTPTGTVTVTGGLTDTQLRAAAVPVDTELPAAAVPTDGDANAAAPAVVARQQVRDGVTGNWYRAASGRGDGQALTPATVAAGGPHNFDSTSSTAFPQRTARSVGDAESGTAFPAVAAMAWAGTAWQRERAPFSEVAIARGIRAAPDPANTAFVTTSPAMTNYGFAGAVFLLRIWAAPTPAANQGLSVKILGNGAGTTGSQSLLTQISTTDAGLSKQAGVYSYVIYPGAAGTQTGVAPLATVASATSAPETPVVASSVPLTPRFTVAVYHRGSTNTFDWDYEVSVAYIR